jgi:hypothetical protein
MKPFIIWTLQRTGGTNLTQRLVDRSSHPGIEHEPLNIGRAMGAVTEQWLRSKDRAALTGAMTGLCARGVNIKHCVELVPREVTESLIDASIAAGYHHLVLYRRQPLGRLLSLHFAKVSGIWGPGQKEQPAEVADPASASLPIASLVQHETRCAAALQKVWNTLIAQSPSVLAVAFEDIYACARPQAAARLACLLGALRLSTDPLRDKRFVDEVLNKGQQGTRDSYDRFEGIAELEQQLQRVPRFFPRRSLACLETIALAPEHPWVHRAVIDAHPAIFGLGEPIKLGGVAVLTADAPPQPRLMYTSDEATQPVYWNMESKGMRDKFKDSPNSARSRFEFICPQLDSSTRLEIHHAGQAPSPLPLLALRTVKPAPRRIHLAIVSMLKDAAPQPNDPDLLALLRETIDAMPAEGRALLWHQSDVLLDVMAGAPRDDVAQRLRALRALHAEADSLQHFEVIAHKLQALLDQRAADLAAAAAAPPAAASMAASAAPSSAAFTPAARAVPSDVCI